MSALVIDPEVEDCLRVRQRLLKLLTDVEIAIADIDEALFAGAPKDVRTERGVMPP
jgi:hypothetical protein